MRDWLKTTLRFLVLAGITVFIVTCNDSSAPFDVGSPLFQISDGATDGNEDLFFLPPLVSNPVGHPNYGDRPLNPDLEGAVFASICALDLATCDVDFDGGDVPGPPWVVDPLPMTLNGDHYEVVWNAKGVPTEVDYRINIFIGNQYIGFRDVDPGQGGACTTEGDEGAFCAFKNNAPIKVRIESFAACIASDPTFDADDPDAACATAFLDPGDYLALSSDEEETIGIATLTQGSGAISMQTCPDLRDRDYRANLEEGLIDLPTFGDCVVMDALVPETDALEGIATLCDAFDEAVGLTPLQRGRGTVHRFSTDPGFEGVYALPHADLEDACSQTAQMQGRLVEEFTGVERFAMALRRSWWTIQDRVRDWIEPASLHASAPLPCHRGGTGCSSSGPFRSHFEVSIPGGIDFHPDPVGPVGPFVRDLGVHDPEFVVQDVMVKAWDSGQCDPAEETEEYVCGDATIEETIPELLANVRLTVKVDEGDNARVREGSSTEDSFFEEVTIYTDQSGVGSFDVKVGDGESTILVDGIGVRVGKGNVYSPDLNDETSEVQLLDDEALEFTVTGFKFDDGFEMEPSAWTPSGEWNRSTLTHSPDPIINAAYTNGFVLLAEGDISEGALPSEALSGEGELPSPFGGYVFWYGEPTSGRPETGNYMETQIEGDVSLSGGESEGPNSGRLVSPEIILPEGGLYSLQFDTWFEIEGFDAHAFDIMEVLVKVGTVETSLGMLNPEDDPDPLPGHPPVPFSSVGYDTAPDWISRTLGVSSFAGSTIQLIFQFDTGDELYNGFRGWIVDNVSITVVEPPSVAGALVAGASVSGGGLNPVPPVASRQR